MSTVDITAEVLLWGTRIGAVTWVEREQLGYFQYDPKFIPSAIEIAPLQMPLSETPYVFPALPSLSFNGLPGLLSDSLPDKFGNRLIDAWLARQGRGPDSFNPVERLCYVGTRGMGALEFQPAVKQDHTTSDDLDLARLVSLTNHILDERTELSGALQGIDDHDAIADILQVGTSAGGARAKAVLAWNQQTGEFRSGQVATDSSFEHWLLKFDGVANNRDKELADPLGFGLVEYAYYKMAIAAGITMMPCRIHHEGGRSHFMTKRFDRFAGENGRIDKLHMQSLAALKHFDFNDSQGYAYEQAIQAIRELGLGVDTLEQQFRRAVFNIVARNQDDHVKNIAFVMNRNGEWALSPAYDVTYSYNAAGEWTKQHQMSVNGKRSNFIMDDLLALGDMALLKRSTSREIVQRVVEVVSAWLSYANDAGVSASMAKQIAVTHRLKLATPV